MRSNGGCAEANLKQLDRARFGFDASKTSRSCGISDRIILDSQARELSSDTKVDSFVGTTSNSERYPSASCLLVEDRNCLDIQVLALRIKEIIDIDVHFCLSNETRCYLRRNVRPNVTTQSSTTLFYLAVDGNILRILNGV